MDIQVRIVSMSEISECPAKRLDPSHYIPIHKIWECNNASEIRTKGRVVSAWRNNIIPSDKMEQAMRYTQEKDKVTDYDGQTGEENRSGYGVQKHN